MDRQKIIDAIHQINEAVLKILDAVEKDQETERAMGQPTESPHGTLAEPR